MHHGPGEHAMPGGDHAAGWDGRDRTGRVVASGTYVVRLTAGGTERTGRVTLVK